MKYQINLYHQEFRPKFEFYTSAHLFAFSLLAILMIAIAYGVSTYFLSAKEAQIAELKASLSATEAEISQVTTEITQREGNPLLKNRLDNLSFQLSQQQTLVNRIQSIANMRNTSFSQMFDAFSESHRSDIWLTSFLIEENQLLIAGELQKATALPVWIGTLNKTVFFSEQEFADAIVERKDDVLSFQLSGRQNEQTYASTSQENNQEQSNGGQ